jgi:hypothetical protein
MDCQDVRLLLAFTRRGGDDIDPTDRAVVEQHLETCPDCASLARSEQAVDAALGAAMRAVPIPPTLKANLLARLAAGRARRWPKVAAAAAAVLLILGGIGVYRITHPGGRATVDVAEVAREVDGRLGQAPEEVEAWFRQAGVEMTCPRQYDYSHLLTYDLVLFEGRRVPKLIFYNGNANTVAQVLVFRSDDFRVNGRLNLPMRLPGGNPSHEVSTEEGADCVYFVSVLGQRDLLLGQPPH